MKNYKRVVIVDPQLKDQKGHNFRYASGIASQLNLPTTVLSHRDFHDSGGSQLTVIPCLSFDQYNNSAFKESFKEPLFDRLGRYKKIIAQRLKEPNAIWEKGSPLARFLSFGIILLDILLFIPALIRQIFWLIRGKGSSAHTDNTALELKAAFESVDLNEHDLLIFQTMMWPTFESLLELRIQADKHYGCDALFLVHEDWLIYGMGCIRFTPAHFAKRVLESLPFRRSKVLSTNAALSDFCQEWCGYRPEVFREIDYPVEALPEKQNNADTKRILIPGVYRGDKNFESLPTLLEQMSETRTGLEICLHRSVAAQVGLDVGSGHTIYLYDDIQGSKAWLEFLAGFDAILLPYGEAYKNRISGIIHEARLLNIPVICSNDIADSGLLHYQECLFDETGKGAAQALDFCLNATPDTRFFVEDYPPSIREHIETEADWIAWQDKPIAVQVKPAWTRCGTTVVLDAQLDYLVERGYFVIEIYLKTDPWMQKPEQIEFMWQVMRGGREYSGGMAVRVLLKEIRLLPLLGYMKQLLRRQIPAFFKRENIHGAWCTPDKPLLHFFNQHPPRLALVNHIFNADFAFKHIPAEKFVCETHDIQINQLLLRRPELKDNYANELRYEMELLQQFDAVVNLNRGEHQQIAASAGDRAHYIRPPIIRRNQAKTYSTLKSLLKAESRIKQFDRIPDRLNLLLIADGHPANVLSVENFLQNIFTSLPQGTTLGVVGTVVKHMKLPKELKKHNNIHYLGFLQSLANIHEFADIQILPDIAGEGIPIKTDEAIANRIPFVATTHAMRGFTVQELNKAGIQTFEEESEMQKHISNLLENDELRMEAVSKVQYLQEINNETQYEVEWDIVLNKLNGA